MGRIGYFIKILIVKHQEVPRNNVFKQSISDIRSMYTYLF